MKTLKITSKEVEKDLFFLQNNYKIFKNENFE